MIKMIKSHIIWFFQRRIRGFDDRELWNLDVTLAKFLNARLKRFVKLKIGHPANLTEGAWDRVLDKMIDATKFIERESYNINTPKWKERVIRDGMDLLAIHHKDLWD